MYEWKPWAEIGFAAVGAFAAALIQILFESDFNEFLEGPRQILITAAGGGARAATAVIVSGIIRILGKAGGSA